MCQKLWKLAASRQSYCKNMQAYFFGPPWGWNATYLYNVFMQHNVLIHTLFGKSLLCGVFLFIVSSTFCHIVFLPLLPTCINVNYSWLLCTGGIFRLYIRFDEGYNDRPPKVYFQSIPFHLNGMFKVQLNFSHILFVTFSSCALLVLRRCCVSQPPDLQLLK